MSPHIKARLTWRQRLCAFIVAALACLFVSAAPAHAAAPTNDDFAAATEITQLPSSETVDGSEASVEPGEETVCSGGVASVWYRFAPDHDMSVKAEANDNITFQTVALSVYTGTSLDALILVTCGTQSPLGYFYPQLVDFDATAGTTYYIRAADFNGALGTFTFDVQELIRPANDDRANAQPVGNLPASVSADTTNATIEPGEQQPCGGITGSVWYSVTTATASDLSVRPASAGVAVYDVDGDLIGCGGPFRTVAGGTYLIQVVSYPTPGPFNFEVRAYTPITGSISVDSSSKIDRSGKVTVSGTLRCTGDFAIGFNVQVTLQQQIGKQPVAQGYGFASPYTPGQICDGRSKAWTAIVYGSQTSTAFWTGSMTATPSATILTDPYYFQANLSGSSSKVSAQRVK
ncbi:hypothetical protein [Microbacterium pumilum]|uniref:Uncharacterized protein n=1 Tax=Microbacterium pumilum TaxID=344165 RepID=A0ABN2T1E5_9MICO